MTYSLEEIASITGGILTGRNSRIERIITDSRNPFDPTATLFVAIRGNNHNGHDYIPTLYQEGVRAFLIDSEIAILKPGLSAATTPSRHCKNWPAAIVTVSKAP